MKKLLKKGFTLTEVILVLAIAAIIIIGIFIIYNKVSTNMKIKREINNISTIISGVKQIYINQPDYSTVDNDLVIKEIAPKDMISDSNNFTLNNVWKGNVVVSKSTYGLNEGTTTFGNTNDSYGSFSITENNLPKSACIGIAENFVIPLYLVKVNSTIIASKSYYNKINYDLTNLVNACNSSNNTLMLISL